MLDAATVPVAALRCLLGQARTELRQAMNACMPRWRLRVLAHPLRATASPLSRRHGVHADASGPRCQLRRAEESAGKLVARCARGVARMRPGHNRGRLPDGQREPPDNPHVAQRKEQPPPKRQAAGSSPAVGAISCDKSRFSWEARKKRPFIRKKTNQGEMEPPHRWRLARVGLGPWGRPLRSARAIPRAVASAVASRQEKSPSIRQECRGLTTKGGQQ